MRGYAVTSYGSQGKTVDTVIMADAANRAATNAEQWYVTISRGRRRVVVFTPDKEALRANVEKLGARELAVDLKTDEVRGRVSAADGVRHSLAVIEQVRRHNDVMAHVRRANNQPRIKL